MPLTDTNRQPFSQELISTFRPQPGSVVPKLLLIVISNLVYIPMVKKSLYTTP